MPKVLLLVLSLTLCIDYCFSQNEADIPVNSETKLVSVNKVVILSDTSTPINKIKQQADNFIKSNSSVNVQANPYKFSKKDRDKMPPFQATKSLDEENMVIYDIRIYPDYYHTAGGFGPVAMKGGDVFEIKLKLYLKKGKFRYDFTNMSHNYVFTNQLKGISGGKFENEKPEQSGSGLNNKKNEWTSMKEDCIMLVKNIAREFEKSFTAPITKSQFDF
jgi:hypothetical protein